MTMQADDQVSAVLKWLRENNLVCDPPTPPADALLDGLQHVSKGTFAAMFLRSYQHRITQTCLKLITKLDPPKKDLVRVYVHDNGTVDLLDFTMPSTCGKERRGLQQSEVPTWIMEAISMLRIAPEGDLVEDIGFKVSDQLYYLVDISQRKGESNERNE